VKGTTEVKWADLHGIREAYRLLSRFRATNTLQGNLNADDLYWELSWIEDFEPLDMDLLPEARAKLRLRTVHSVVLSCAQTKNAIGHSVSIRNIAKVVEPILLNCEQNRGSMHD
jgi:hypothetical protein